jgi:hypothetical protein
MDGGVDGGVDGGTGTGSEDCFVPIASCAELQAMRDGRNGVYRLTQSIDCTSFDFGDGGGFMPVGQSEPDWEAFTGSLDGAGHTITGLTIDRPGSDEVALFGLTEDAELVRIGLVNADISGHWFVAPLVALSEGTSISQSFATGSASGDKHVAGLVARMGGELSDSYTSVAVTSASLKGLLSWSLDSGSVQRTYSAGTSGSGSALVSYIDSGTVGASFFDCDVAGNCGASFAASTSAMQSDTQYLAAGWDMSTVWALSEPGSYPCLRWQPGCGAACAADDTTCDGQDDDCDSTLDEDYASSATSCGVGACAAARSMVWKDEAAGRMPITAFAGVLAGTLILYVTGIVIK